MGIAYFGKNYSNNISGEAELIKKMFKMLFNSKNKGLNTNHKTAKQVPVSPELDTVQSQVVEIFGNTADLVLRKILLSNGSRPAMVVYLENMVDLKAINESIIAQLQEANHEAMQNAKLLAATALANAEVKITSNLDNVIKGIMNGNTAIFVGGLGQALVAGTIGYPTRSIMPPETEVTIEGPKEAFVEALATNITLVRRRLKDPNLRFENLILGTRSHTKVTVGYFHGITDPGIYAEVKKRLQAIQVDGILAAEMVQEYLTDHPLSIFPTLLKRERPDQVVSCLLEGRVAIFVDGYPWVFTCPITFPQLLQSGDDYYQNFYYGTFLRWIRYLCLIVTLTLPSFWLAMVTHHWEMLPTPLALAVAGGRSEVPFPIFLEIIGMEFTFEILREAGIRLPKAVGQAVSIVGALVIGQAAVQAGLVSPAVVIIVALTGVCSFTIPNNSASVAIRLLRFPLILLTSQIGLLGLMAGLMVIWGYMTHMTSFGVPYLSPFMPFRTNDLKDSMFRIPRWAMATRPQSNPSMDPIRTKTFMPPKGGDQDDQ